MCCAGQIRHAPLHSSHQVEVAEQVVVGARAVAVDIHVGSHAVGPHLR